MSRWIEADPIYSHRLPDVPAVYVFVLDSRYLFVGSTESLRKRMGSHDIRHSHGGELLTPWGQCSTVQMRYRQSRRLGDWLMDEFRLIRKLQPVLNCQGSTRKRDLGVKRIAGVPTVEMWFPRQKAYISVFTTVDDYLSGVVRRPKEYAIERGL